MSDKFCVGMIVDNHSGVLNRIASMYTRRGYNIHSITAGPTEDPRYTRITIVSNGDEYIKSQVFKQLNKLYDVKIVKFIDEDRGIYLEHLLIKLKYDGKGMDIDAKEAKVMELGDGYIILDLTGTPDEISRFIEACIPYGILEVARTGVVALTRDSSDMLGGMHAKDKEIFEDVPSKKES